MYQHIHHFDIGNDKTDKSPSHRLRSICSTGVLKYTAILIWYGMDCVIFWNISVIQQDTQYLMINFIHNIQ